MYNYLKKHFFLITLSLIAFSCASNKFENSSIHLTEHQKLKVVRFELFNLPEKKAMTLEQYDRVLTKIIHRGTYKNKNLIGNELFLKATDLSFRGDAAFAAILYKHLLSLRPKDKIIKRKYAIELIRSGQIKQSLPLLETLIFPKIKDSALALVLAGVYTALDKKIKARNVYRTVWRKYKSIDSCIFWAKNLISVKQKKKGIQVLNRCLKAVKSPQFEYALGQIYVENKKFNLAQNHFLRALKIDPLFDKAAIAYGLILESKDLSIKAIKFYKNFLKRNSGSFSVTSRIVQLMFVNNYGKKIIPYAEQLVNIDPDDLNTKVKLGILYTEGKDFDKAKGLFKEILAAAPNSDKILYYVAALNQQTGDYSEALEFFYKIKSESNLFLDSNIQISNILKRLALEEYNTDHHFGDQYTTFLTFTSARLQHQFNDIKLSISLNLATFYEEIGKVKKAIVVMEQLKDSKNIKNEKFQFKDEQMFYLASLYDKIKDYKNSTQLVKIILKHSPNNADALNFLGYSYLERNIHSELTLKYLTKANELKPKNGYILDSLGWYYFKQGDHKRALELITKAWKYANQDMVIAKHLALIYQKLKFFIESKRYYIEALKNCTNFKDKKSIIQSIMKLESLRVPASSTSSTSSTSQKDR